MVNDEELDGLVVGDGVEVGVEVGVGDDKFTFRATTLDSPEV